MKQISFFSVFLAIFVQAQKFQPAVVTFNNNDQVAGSVAYNTPVLTPQTFEFKDASNQLKKIGVNQIKEVDVTAKTKFIKADIEISRHSENLQTLEQNQNFNLKKEERFIEQIVFGKYNLYKYADDMNKAYYYSTSDSDGIKPLLFKEYFLDNGDKTSNKEYLSTLQKLNCGNIDFNNVRYLESSLVNYFTKINQCDGVTTPQYEKAKGYMEHKVFALYTQKQEFTGAGFGGGYEFEYHLPFNNYSFAVAAAPGFTIYNLDENAVLSFYQGAYTRIISLPILLRYYPVKTKDFKMYASYSIVNFSQVNEEFMSYNNKKETDNYFTAFVNNYFEVGARYKAVEAFARFNSKLVDNAISVGLKYNIYSTKK